jgi:hypothetical protein
MESSSTNDLPNPTGSSPPPYSDSQISQYLSHISFPVSTYPIPTPQALKDLNKHYPITSPPSSTANEASETSAHPNELSEEATKALNFLSLLQRHHLAAIPFENLSLHYSKWKGVGIKKEEVWQKMIGDGRGRGGYCMENNRLFGAVLKSLGFEVYALGARVYNQTMPQDGGFNGW